MSTSCSLPRAGLQRVTPGPDAGAGSAPAKAKGKPGRKKKGAGERAAGAASFTVAAPAPAPAPAAGAGGAGPKQAKPRSPRGKRKAPPPASPAAAPFVHADEDQDAAQGDFDERSSGPLEDNPLMRSVGHSHLLRDSSPNPPTYTLATTHGCRLSPSFLSPQVRLDEPHQGGRLHEPGLQRGLHR